MMKVISLLCLSLFFFTTIVVSQSVVSLTIVEYNSSDCSGTPITTVTGEVNNGACTFGIIYKFYESTVSACVYEEIDCSGTVSCSEVDAGCNPTLPGQSDMISWTFGPAPTPAPGTSDVYITTNTYSQENCLGPKTSSYTVQMDNGECFVQEDVSVSYNFTQQSFTACFFDGDNDCTGTPDTCASMLAGCIDMGDGTSMDMYWIFDNGTTPTQAPTPAPTAGPTLAPNQSFNVTASLYSQENCAGNVDTQEYIIMVNAVCNNAEDHSFMYIFYESSIQACDYSSQDCTGSSYCGTILQGCNNNGDGDSAYISWEPVSTSSNARDSHSLRRALLK